MPRKPLSKKVRFEVFKRDSFTCQYCGAAAPEVILHVDHIKPVSKGGDNSIANLITSCQPCNSGKSNRELSDDSAVKKQKRQLDDLNERRIQLEMMVDWRSGLQEISEMETDVVVNMIDDNWGIKLSDTGLRKISSWTRKFGVAVVIDAVCELEDAAIDADGDQLETDKIFMKIPKVCGFKKKCKEDPDYQRIAYIRGILRNRLHYINHGHAIDITRRANEAGMHFDHLEEIAKTCRNWTDYTQQLSDFMSGVCDE